MSTLQDQVKVHRDWLRAAGGDLRIVERALGSVTQAADSSGRQATVADVNQAIADLRADVSDPVEAAYRALNERGVFSLLVPVMYLKLAVAQALEAARKAERT